MLRIASEDHVDSSVNSQHPEGSTAAAVAARLRRSGYPFLWGVTCTFNAGEVVLSGTVPTFYLKQVAQELAGHTPGVFRVDNRLQVTGAPRPARRTAERAAKPVAAGQRGPIDSASPGRSRPVRHPMTSPPALEIVASSAVEGRQGGTF